MRGAVAVLAAPARTAEPVVSAYVFPKNGVVDPALIDVRRLTRINYAFALIGNGHIVPSTPSDLANLATLTELRKQKPSLQIVISVGGWLGGGGFSDMVLTPESRAVFEQSAMDFLEKYDLDGIDIDWEYPGQAGPGNRFRPEDKQNFSALLEELRARFDARTKTTHRHLYLTIAAGSGDDYIEHTEMARIARVLDDVNLMTYDMYEPDGNNPTGIHSPLFADPCRHRITPRMTPLYMPSSLPGVPAEKIVLGVPFYATCGSMCRTWNHGLFQPGKPPANGFGAYDNIRTQLLGHGYTRYWDDASKVPYLYSAEQKTFVSYEDPESLGIKCDYVRAHKLAGIMFWSYYDDTSGRAAGRYRRRFASGARQVSLFAGEAHAQRAPRLLKHARHIERQRMRISGLSRSPSRSSSQKWAVS